MRKVKKMDVKKIERMKPSSHEVGRFTPAATAHGNDKVRDKVNDEVIGGFCFP